MRQTISGLVAAIAVMTASAAPASACGLFESTCGQSYVVAPVYWGCNCGGVYERLPDPAYQYGAQPYPAVHQYYYADQGPTFTGPGDFAPYPTYREGALPYYGGYHSHYWGHRYGYGHHGYGHHGYAAHYNMRYGYHGMPHQYGYRQQTRRYY
jgi:hypothetical protein